MRKKDRLLFFNPMNIEDIKVGETYNVRMKYVGDNESGLHPFVLETIPHIFRHFDKKDIETCVFPLLPPENGIKNTETAPKYDQNRLFRKGDKVRLVKYKNRTPYDLENYCMVEEEGCVYTLPEDETEDGFVCIDEEHSVCVCYLELFTPVEELEPYSVSEATVQYLVKEDNKKVVAQFCKLYHPNAKAAAEAECARLNAEYRKEQE